MKRGFALSLALFLCIPFARADALTGPAEAIDGDTLSIAGTTVHLAGIAAPPLARWCLHATKKIPCGSIARDALLDLITAMEVTCRLTGERFENRPDAVCVAGGFEINVNMVYTGWALPLPDTGYGPTRDGAREDRRGLWATNYVRD